MPATYQSAPKPQRDPRAQGPDEHTVAQMLEQIASVHASGKSDSELLPKRLSPSRAGDYKTCPRSFYYRALIGLSSPPTQATARGTVAHTAFERTFDHPAGTRTPELTKAYVRPAWQSLVDPQLDPVKHALGTKRGDRVRENAKAYRELAPAGSAAEREIIEFAERMVDNWYLMERVNNFDPSKVALPSGDVIDGREVRVGTPLFGVYVNGFIDRLDVFETAAGNCYCVTDYKSGAVPAAGKTYSPATMDRIEWDSFFQLRTYALLMWEIHKVPVKLLRLVYVATGDRDNGIKTLTVTRDVIERTRAEIRAVWNSIVRSADTGTWQPKPGPLCAWCYYLDLCPAYTDRVA